MGPASSDDRSAAVAADLVAGLDVTPTAAAALLARWEDLRHNDLRTTAERVAVLAVLMERTVPGPPPRFTYRPLGRRQYDVVIPGGTVVGQIQQADRGWRWVWWATPYETSMDFSTRREAAEAVWWNWQSHLPEPT